jgi:hexokinase
MDPREAARRFLRASGMYHGDVDLEVATKAFLAEMARGLSGAASSLLMIPTFIEVDREVRRRTPVLAIDAGGTHLRVALVEVESDGAPRVSDFRRYAMPGVDREVSSRELFAVLADRILDLVPRSASIGFSFSYPVEMLPSKDGKIIGLWKELEVPDAAGQLVAEALGSALRDAGARRELHVVVLNDTVAALLAGRTAGGGRHTRHVGFVLGTGTNCAYVESNARITKRGDLRSGGAQVVNVESGAYGGFRRGAIDLNYDAGSADPGRYPFEKCISGAYLGGLCLEVLRSGADAGLFSSPGAEAIRTHLRLETPGLDPFLGGAPEPASLHGALLARGGPADAAMACQLVDLIVERAAKLAAISMAAAVLKGGEGRPPEEAVCVTVDGSTFYGLRSFRTRVTSFIDAALPDRLRPELVAVEHAALVGAAICALTN